MFISTNPTVPAEATETKPASVTQKDLSPADSLKSPRVEKAIKDFEGLFLSMMIKELRQTSSGEGLFPGDASDTYGGMFDMFLGDHLASAGSIGIGQLFRSSGAMMQLENYAMPTFAANADGRSKGIEEYQNEQLRSGAISALSAP